MEHSICLTDYETGRHVDVNLNAIAQVHPCSTTGHCGHATIELVNGSKVHARESVAKVWEGIKQARQASRNS